MVLFAQIVVFAMTTFWAYQVGNWFGFQKGSDKLYYQMKKVYEGCN